MDIPKRTVATAGGGRLRSTPVLSRNCCSRWKLHSDVWKRQDDQAVESSQRSVDQAVHRARIRRAGRSGLN